MKNILMPPSSAFIPQIPHPFGRLLFHPRNRCSKSPIPRFVRRLCATYRVPNYTTPDYSSTDRQDHLLEAVKFNDFGKFKHLVDTLPNGPNTVFVKKNNQSVLLAACFRGRTDMIRYLVQRGADCAYVNDFGWGAVKYCKQFYWNLKLFDEGHQIIQVLIANGAEDVKDWRDGY